MVIGGSRDNAAKVTDHVRVVEEVHAKDHISAR
jgi:hypothetical protein